MNTKKTASPFPILEYHKNHWLIVDRAWIDARQKVVLVEIGGRYFEIDMEDALYQSHDEKLLDQCYLMTVNRGPSEADWPLGQEGHEPAFRFLLRHKVPAEVPPSRTTREQAAEAWEHLMVAQEAEREAALAALAREW